MGCGSSAPETIPEKEAPKPVEAPVEVKANDKIPISKGSFDENGYEIKILTLGAGECGKTTLWRQLKIICCGGFTKGEKMALSNSLKINILSDIIALINFAVESNQKIPSDIESDVEIINECDPNNPEELTEEVADAISRVWADPIMKQIYKQANSIGIGDNADHFLNEVKRIAAADYVPTDQDILKARIRTVGVNNLFVEVGSAKKKTILVDVGGQRNERSKWSNCFKNVTYVMFVVSLSDFDQKMFEDGSKSRTEDSIELFKNIASTPEFANVPFFLILNKFDIFKKKIKEDSKAFLSAYPGFTGDVNNEDQCIEHIKQTFISKLPDRSSDAWTEAIPTCAMDQDSVDSLFQIIGKKIQERN